MKISILSSGCLRGAVSGLVAVTAAVVGVPPVHAEPGSDLAELISFFDKEYKPGLLTMGLPGGQPDGNYLWRAKFPNDLRMPAEKLGALCAKQGGKWSLLVSPVYLLAFPDNAVLRFGNESYTVRSYDLWIWATGYSPAGQLRPRSGFDPVFDYRLIRGRARGVAEANANPPLGLFGCSEASGSMKWAASIMPGRYGGIGWLYLIIRPVTRDYLVEVQRKKLELEKKERDYQQSIIARAREAERLAAEEDRRLQPWRQQLKIGDQTNCGMVVDVRGPLVEVQLPPHISGPNDIRQFWIQRSHLTNRPAGVECRYGG